MSFKKSILFLFSTIAVTLSLCAELSITKLNKISGGTTGFSSIAIYGSGFSKTAQIYFGDQRVILNRWVRDDLIHILTTKYPNEETVDVKIVQGEEEFILPNAYTFVDKAPTLNSINKSEGLTEGGLSVTLKGVQLTPVSEIKFGDQTVNKYTFLHDRRVVMTSPSSEAGIVDVSYSNALGQDSIEDGFEYLADTDPRAAPVITSVNRTTILPSGNAKILVRGKNFSTAGQWSVGSFPAEKVIHSHSERVYIHTPVLAAEGAITLSYVGNSGTVDLVDAFNVTEKKPNLTNMIPNKGFTESVTLIRLNGKYFTDSMQLFIGEQEAEFFRFDHDGQALFKVQPQSAGIFDLKLVTAYGEQLLPGAFEFADNLPRIDYLWPSTGPIQGATKVIVRGNYFHLNDLVADLNGTIQPIYTHKDTRSFGFLSEAVPQAASVDLTVTTSEGVTTRENAYLYETQRPVIDYIRPLLGPTTGNKFIDIYGVNFTANTNIQLGGQEYSIHRFYNSGRIRIKTQATDAGVTDLSIVNENGSDSFGSCYTFIDDAAANAGEPIVSWIKNARSPLTGNTPVIVRGKNFGEELSVTLNGVPVNFTRHSKIDQIKFKTQQELSAVNHDLVLTNEFGSTTIPNAIQFVEEEPIFYSIKENDGYVHGDTFFTVYGRFFTPTIELLIDGTPAKTHRFHNSQSVTFQSPGGSLGTKNLELVSEFGTLTLNDAWNYKGIPPQVTRVNPNIGEAEGGSFVRVYGKFFSPSSVVLFNGVEGTDINVINTRQIKVRVPDNSGNAGGLVDIQVVTEFGTSVLPKGYYYKPSATVNAAPAITSAAITTATEDVTYSYEVSVLDPDDANDGVNLTWSLSNSPAGMTINNTGVISWLPTEGILTSSEVTVSVADGGEDGAAPATQSFTIAVTPINDAPVITSSAPNTATEDVLYSYEVIVSDPDDLNDGVGISWSLLNAPTGMSVSNTGLITWTPSEGVLTSGQVTVIAKDGQEDFADEAEEVFEISVTPVNDVPSITSAPVLAATEDVIYSYAVSVVDPDNSSFSWNLNNAPAGMSINNAGVISWTPGEGVLTSGEVTVSVSDGALSDAQSFTISVTAVNDSPVITSIAITTATEDTAYSYQVVVSDPDDIEFDFSLSGSPVGMTISESGLITWTPTEGILTSGEVTVTVADGGEDEAIAATQVFTISVAAVNDSPVITSAAPNTATEDVEYVYAVIVSDVDDENIGSDLIWTLSNEPEGMAISTTGVITWTPGESVLTSGEVTVTVADGGEDEAVTASEVFTLTVTPVNDSPVITSSAPNTATEDIEYIYTVSVSDSDDENNGTDLAWSLTNAPEGMAVSTTGVITWTPGEGILTSGEVTVTVADGGEDGAVVANESFEVIVSTLDTTLITIDSPENGFHSSDGTVIISGQVEANHEVEIYLNEEPLDIDLTYDTNVITSSSNEFWASGTMTNLDLTEENGEYRLELAKDTSSSAAYSEAIQSNSTFELRGTPQNWNGYYQMYQYDLDFTFPFFGKEFTEIYVDSNGRIAFPYLDYFFYEILEFDPTANPADFMIPPESYGQDEYELEYVPTIAPFWDDLDATYGDGDIYIYEEDGFIQVTWDTFGWDGEVAQFSVTLHETGKIEFKYGQMDYQDSYPSIAIASGEGSSEIIYSSLNYETIQANQSDIIFDNQVPVLPNGEFVSDIYQLNSGYIYPPKLDADVFEQTSLDILYRYSEDGFTFTNWSNQYQENVKDYVQFKYQFTTNNNFSPILKEHTFYYSDSSDPVIYSSDTINIVLPQNTIKSQIINSTASAEIQVNLIHEPLVAFSDEYNLTEDHRASFPVLDNDVDDYNIINLIDVSIESVNGGQVTIIGDNILYIPVDDFNGVDTFSYTISDGQYTSSNTVTVNVSAVNDPPNLVYNSQINVFEDTGVNTFINALGNLTPGGGVDEAGQNLTITITNDDTDLFTIQPYFINDLDLEFELAPDAYGLATLSVEVQDNGTPSMSNTFTYSLNVININDPPRVLDDQHQTDEDVPLLIAAIYNDSDDGPFELKSFQGTTANNGNVILDGPFFLYTPAANFNGLDTFTYEVIDDHGEVVTGNVFITINSISDQFITNFDNVSVEANSNILIDVLENDISENDIAISQFSDNTINGGNIAFLNGKLLYTPAIDFIGSDNFTYVAISDGLELTSSVYINVYTHNLPPVAVEDVVELDESQSIEINILNNDYDLDGDDIQLVNISDSFFTDITSSSDGSLVIQGKDNLYGEEVLTYTIKDKFNTASNTITIKIDPVNEAPIGVNQSSVTYTNANLILFTLQYFNTYIPNLISDEEIDLGLNSSYIEMIDYDNEYITVTPVSGYSQQNGLVTFSNNQLIYQPPTDFVGLDQFSYTLRDEAGYESPVYTIDVEIKDSSLANSPNTFLEPNLLKGYTNSLRPILSGNLNLSTSIDQEKSYVMIDGVELVDVVWSNAGFIAVPSTNLIDGVNYNLELKVVDQLGLEKLTGHSFIVDVTSPTVSLSLSESKEYFNKAPIEIDLSYSDSNSGVTNDVFAYLNGELFSEGPASSYSISSPDLGLNIFTVIVSDEASNYKSSSISFVFDNEPPEIIIESPENGEDIFSLYSNVVYINGHVEDISGIAYAYVAGPTGNNYMRVDGLVFYDEHNVALEPDSDSATINVIVVDKAGNESMESVDVSFNRAEGEFEAIEYTSSSNFHDELGYSPMEYIGPYLYRTENITYDHEDNYKQVVTSSTGGGTTTRKTIFNWDRKFDIQDKVFFRELSGHYSFRNTYSGDYINDTINSHDLTSSENMAYRTNIRVKKYYTLPDPIVDEDETDTELYDSGMFLDEFVQLYANNSANLNYEDKTPSYYRKRIDFDYYDYQENTAANGSITTRTVTQHWYKDGTRSLSDKFGFEDVVNMIPDYPYPELKQVSGPISFNVFREAFSFDQLTKSPNSNYSKFRGLKQKFKFRFITSYEKNRPYRFKWKERKIIYSDDMEDILADYTINKYFPQDKSYLKGTGANVITDFIEYKIDSGFEWMRVDDMKFDTPYIYIENLSPNRNINPASNKDYIYFIKDLKSKIVLDAFTDKERVEERPVKYIMIESPEGWSINQQGQVFAQEDAHNGRLRIRVQDFEVESVYEDLVFDADNCYACNENCSFIPEIGSVYLNINLGKDVFGRELGQIVIHEKEITDESFNLNSINMVSFSDDVVIEKVNSGNLMYVTTPNKHYKVFNTIVGYTLQEFKNLGDGIDSNLNPNLLIQEWRIERVNNDNGINSLNMICLKGEDTKEYLFEHNAVTNSWKLTKDIHGSQEKETLEYIYKPEDDSTIRFYSIYSDSGELISHNCEKFCTIESTNLKLDQIEDPFGQHRKTIYEYDLNHESANFKKLLFKMTPDGQWSKYQYSDDGLLIKVVKQLGNNSRDTLDEENIEVSYNYEPLSSDDDGSLKMSPRAIFTRVEGEIIKTVYRVIGYGYEKVIHSYSQSPSIDDLNNEFVETKYFTEGPYEGGIKYQVDSENNAILNEFIIDDDKIFKFKLSGIIVNDDFVSGTNTITIKSIDGRLLSEQVIDIETEILKSEILYSNFDIFNRAKRIDYLDGTFEELSFSCCGLESKLHRDGSITTWTRYDDGSVESETKNGITRFYLRDALGRVIEESVIDKNGVETVVKTTEYNLAGEVVSTTNSKGETTTYSKSQDPDGCNVSTTTYHDGSTSIRKTCQDGSLYQITGTRNITKTYERGINLDGTQWSKEYIGQIGSSEWTKTTRDLQGHVINVEKANGAISTNHYNNDGQLEKAVDFDGVTTLYSYLPNGDAEYVAIDINQNGIIDLAGPDQISQTISDISTYNDEPVYRTRNYTWFEGSSTGNLISTSYRSIDGQRSWSESNGLVSNSETTIDAATETKTVTSTLACSDGSCVDKVSTQNYENGLLTSQNVVDAGGNVISSVSYVYDELNRVESQTDHTGRTTTFGYEGVTGERTSTTVAGGGDLSQTTSVSEENADGVIERTLSNGNIVYTELNEQGQVTRTWGEGQYPQEHDYDSAGRKISTKSWKNFETSEGAAMTYFNFNAFGELESITNDQGQSTIFTYTDGGLVKTQTNANGVTVTYHYDNANRVILKEFSDGLTASVSTTYTRLGKVDTVTDGRGQVKYHYSTTGQLNKEEWLTGTLAGFSQSYGQDVFGRENSFTLNDGLDNFQEKSTSYDSAGRLQTITHGDDQATYHYNAAGQVGTMVRSRSGSTVVSTNKTYDELGRLESIHHANSSATVQSFTYQLNDSNQRTRTTEASGQYWEYSYDSKNQLTSAIKYLADGTEIPGLRFEYDFDDVGNRKTAEGAGYRSNSLNQYTDRDVLNTIDVIGTSSSTDVTVDDLVTVRTEEYYHKQVTIDNTVTVPYAIDIKEDGVLSKQLTGYLQSSPEYFIHDDAGNLVEDGLRYYYYDGDNRLKRVEAKHVNLDVEFTSDHLGRRFSKRVLIDGILSYERYFIYKGWNLVAELDENLDVVKTYTYGQDLTGGIQGIGGLLFVKDHVEDKVYYSLSDGNGNVKGQVDALDGSLYHSVEYGPFGKVLHESGTRVTDLGFSSMPLDQETGLVYNKDRYYSPSMGRWTQADRIGMKGGLNLYGFVGNGPINSIDILGQYQRDVHGYFSYFAALAAGASSKQARRIGFFTWGPDATKALNAIDAFGIWAPASVFHIQRSLHALTGGSAIQLRAEVVKEAYVNTPDNDIRFGFMSHLFQDTYAHIKLGTTDTLYPDMVGHLEDWTDPDLVSVRPELFKDMGEMYYALVYRYLEGPKLALSISDFKKYTSAIAGVPDANREDFIKYIVTCDSTPNSQFDSILQSKGLKRLKLDKNKLEFVLPGDGHYTYEQNLVNGVNDSAWNIK